MDAGAFWDERFAIDGYLFGAEPNAFVVEACAGLPPGRALDLGCGEGRNAVWLAGRGHEVTAVDVSRVGLAKARELAAAAGVEVDFVEGDLGDYEPEPGGYDLVLLSYLQVEPELRTRIHSRAAAALAPGGSLVLVAHHRDNLEHGVGGPQHPDLLFTEDQLRSDLAGLRLERCERVERVVEAGAGPGEPSIALDVVVVAIRP